jgi:hypothetical protein
MAMADAATIASNWAQAMSGAGAKYSAGIQRVTESPMAKAAANVQGYLQGIQDAVASGKWVAGLNRVPLQAWKDAATQTGAQRLASGAAKAKPKVLAFLQAFLPVLQANVNQVRGMPNATYEERKARALAMMDLNHGFKRS